MRRRRDYLRAAILVLRYRDENFTVDDDAFDALTTVAEQLYAVYRREKHL